MLRELEGLVAQYARSRETLFKSIQALTDAQLKVPMPGRDWSIQDTLVHIAANEALMTRLLSDIVHGTTNALPSDFDNQKFNEASVAAGRAKTVQQVRADLDASYAKLIAVLETITPETIDRRGVHPASGDSNAKEFLLGMYAHHEVHTRDVVKQARRLKKG